MTADQLAAWRKALADRARQQRTRRAGREPEPVRAGMLRVSPARHDDDGPPGQPARQRDRNDRG